VDEAVAISQVIRLMKNPDYAQFRCVVFDTAPTGHTLRLLTLPDFLNTGVGKIVRLRFAIANALSGVTSFFTGKSGRTVDQAVAKLEQLQVRKLCTWLRLSACRLSACRLSRRLAPPSARSLDVVSSSHPAGNRWLKPSRATLCCTASVWLCVTPKRRATLCCTVSVSLRGRDSASPAHALSMLHTLGRMHPAAGAACRQQNADALRCRHRWRRRARSSGTSSAPSL
jgi:Anion-transporting ATPase